MGQAWFWYQISRLLPQHVVGWLVFVAGILCVLHFLGEFLKERKISSLGKSLLSVLIVVINNTMACDRKPSQEPTAATAPPAPQSLPREQSAPNVRTPQPLSEVAIDSKLIPTSAPKPQDATEAAAKAFPAFAGRFDTAYRRLCIQRQANEKVGRKGNGTNSESTFGNGYKADVKRTESVLNPVVGEIRIPQSLTSQTSVPEAGFFSEMRIDAEIVCTFTHNGKAWRLMSAASKGTEKTTRRSSPLAKGEEDSKPWDVDLMSDPVLHSAVEEANQ